MKTIEQRTKEIQKDCHYHVGILIKTNDNVTYQDATTVFLFKKLAELQHEVERLREQLCL